MAKTSRLLPLATALLSVIFGCDPPPTSIPPGQAPTMGPEPSPARPPPPTRPPRPIAESVDAGAPATDPATPPAAGGEVGAADGAACKAAADCQSGLCEGEGCGAASSGVCVSRKRPCTADLRAYCGCDGVTFNASSSCPGRRYASRGECKR